MTGEQKALKAWLSAQTPAGGQPGLIQGAAMLTTPHLQGLLQQLRISTPSLGAQVGSTRWHNLPSHMLAEWILHRLMLYDTVMYQALHLLLELCSVSVWTSNLHW